MTGRRVDGGREGVTQAAIQEGKAKRVPAGSLLLSFKLSIGKVAFTTADLYPNEAIAWLQPRECITQSFLGLALESVDWSSLGGRAVKGKTLNSAALDSVPIPLPPLAEQRRIVDVMSAVDDAIEATEHQVSASSTSITALRGRIFKNVSESASQIRADQMFDMLLGRQKSARQTRGDHVIPYLRAANIKPDGLQLDDVLTMNFEPHEQQKYNLEVGDVLLVEGGSIGTSAAWAGQVDGPVGFDKHVIRLRPRPGSSSTEFALQWTRWANETGQFAVQATGITIKALSFGRASAMQVPMLSLEDQNRLVEPLSAAENELSQARRISVRLRTLRSSLLSVLLSGEHEIPESYDELLGAVV